jgi:ADP-ribose pyrophosphatase
MEIKSTKVVYECPIFKIEERQVIAPTGAEQTYWRMVRAPQVTIIALTTDKKIVLIKEIIGDDDRECLVMPGGKVESYTATEEDIKQQALAELHEEAGYKANKIELLFKEEAPWNTLKRSFYKFVAWDLEDVGQKLDPEEKITRHLVTLEEAERIIKNREITAPEEERALEKAIQFFKDKGLL